MSQGWILLHRKLFDNKMWLSQRFTRAQAWVDLLLLANHKEGFFYVRGIQVSIKRGSVGWSQESLSKRWKWSAGKVDRFLKQLKNERQIEYQKNNLSLCITLINYDQYQENGRQNDTQTETKRKPNGRQTEANNNGNNGNQKDGEPFGSEKTPPPLSSKETIFNLGVNLLINAGERESSARSFLGKLAKNGEDLLAEKIGWLSANPKIDPKSYLIKAMQAEKRELVL